MNRSRESKRAHELWATTVITAIIAPERHKARGSNAEKRLIIQGLSSEMQAPAAPKPRRATAMII